MKAIIEKVNFIRTENKEVITIKKMDAFQNLYFPDMTSVDSEMWDFIKIETVEVSCKKILFDVRVYKNDFSKCIFHKMMDYDLQFDNQDCALTIRKLRNRG